MFSQHEVGGEIVSSPALEQCGNGRTELVEEITQLKALLRVERNISHAAGVYGRPKRGGSNVSDGGLEPEGGFVEPLQAGSVGEGQK